MFESGTTSLSSSSATKTGISYSCCHQKQDDFLRQFVYNEPKYTKEEPSMSFVIGTINENGVVISADSRESWNDKEMRRDNAIKVFNGTNWILGFSGLLEYCDETRNIYRIEDFVNDIRFREESYNTTNDIMFEITKYLAETQYFNLSDKTNAAIYMLIGINSNGVHGKKKN